MRANFGNLLAFEIEKELGLISNEISLHNKQMMQMTAIQFIKNYQNIQIHCHLKENNEYRKVTQNYNEKEWKGKIVKVLLLRKADDYSDLDADQYYVRSWNHCRVTRWIKPKFLQIISWKEVISVFECDYFQCNINAQIEPWLTEHESDGTTVTSGETKFNLSVFGMRAQIDYLYFW